MPVATAAPVWPGASGQPAPFRWSAGDSAPPYRLVVLDEAYGELLVRDGIETTAWTPDPAACAALQRGATYHWLVLGDDRGRPAASPLGSFRID